MINKRGFTLVELLIVMAIIAILAVGSFASYNGVRMSARDGRRKTDLENIRGALQLYFADNKTYPPTATINALVCGTDFIKGPNVGDPEYLKFPCDPTTGYVYVYQNTGVGKYTLGARLEREAGSNCLAGCNGANQCNYCVNNP